MRTTPQHLAAEYRASGAWSEQRIGDLYASSAAVEPARIALVDPPNRAALDGASPRRLDWRSLSALIDATMVALADAGLRRDDVLVTQLPNVVEYVAVYLACARLGRRREPGADAISSRRARAALQADSRTRVAHGARVQGNGARASCNDI